MSVYRTIGPTLVMITMVILPKTSHKQKQSEKYNHSFITYPIATLKGDKKNKRVWKFVKTNPQIRNN